MEPTGIFPPLPWLATHNTGSSMQGYKQSSAVVGTGANCKTLVAGCFYDIAAKEGVGKQLASANAEFIAEACNAHGALIDALRTIATGTAIDPAQVAQEVLAKIKSR